MPKHHFVYLRFSGLLSALLIGLISFGQSPAPKKKTLTVKITGNMGVTYEGYQLDKNPAGNNFYTRRRPWNQVRYVFNPLLQIGKKLTIPLNVNFQTFATNLAGPYAGLKKQNLGQFLTNPANNFGMSPKYKWAELLLGTQYLKYSDLSTGDIGIFGAGINLTPGKFVLKVFTGVSQQGVNYLPTPPPGVTGAYKRNHYMFQIGTQQEDKYKLVLNLAKAKDKIGSVSSPPLSIKPQEGFTISAVAEKKFESKWFIALEGAQSVFTKDLTQPINTNSKTSFKPFITARTSSAKDLAGMFSVGKKSTDLDISYSTKYIGAGYQTTGFPFMQTDHWDNTLNTRFNAFKKKMNVTASVGQRVNNLSNTSTRANQFIGNINVFAQFTDRLSLNANYNNFGFQTASGLNPYGIKNVSNDLGISPTYTWTTASMSNTLTMSYNYSKYDERDVISGLSTSNRIHTAVFTYVPTFFEKEWTPEFSVVYFYNTLPAFKNRMLTVSTALGMPLAKKKIQVRGQLQYMNGVLNAFTANNNLIASCNVDYKINKKLSWNSFFSSNYFKYGDELGSIPLIGANYLESNIRTGLAYKF